MGEAEDGRTGKRVGGICDRQWGGMQGKRI